MKALVYTGVEELKYREEKNPVETSGDGILIVQASGLCVRGRILLWKASMPIKRMAGLSDADGR